MQTPCCLAPPSNASHTFFISAYALRTSASLSDPLRTADDDTSAPGPPPPPLPRVLPSRDVRGLSAETPAPAAGACSVQPLLLLPPPPPSPLLLGTLALAAAAAASPVDVDAADADELPSRAPVREDCTAEDSDAYDGPGTPPSEMDDSPGLCPGSRPSGGTAAMADVPLPGGPAPTAASGRSVSTVRAVRERVLKA